MKAASINGLGAVPNKELQLRKLKKACEDFEAIMVNYLFKSMRQTTFQTESEGFGSCKELYEGMMDEALASQISQQEGMGLARLLYEQLSPAIEAKEPNDRGNDKSDSSLGAREPIS